MNEMMEFYIADYAFSVTGMQTSINDQENC